MPCIVITFLALFGLEGSAFAQQFDHCVWNGLRFYDLIFPLFLFISGVTFPFSYAAQRAKGATTARIVRKIFTRTVLLVLFGSIAGLLSPAAGAFVTQVGMIALGWLLLFWLYRKGVFLRV